MCDFIIPATGKYRSFVFEIPVFFLQSKKWWLLVGLRCSSLRRKFKDDSRLFIFRSGDD